MVGYIRNIKAQHKLTTRWFFWQCLLSLPLAIYFLIQSHRIIGRTDLNAILLKGYDYTIFESIQKKLPAFLPIMVSSLVIYFIVQLIVKTWIYSRLVEADFSGANVLKVFALSIISFVIVLSLAFMNFYWLFQDPFLALEELKTDQKLINKMLFSGVTLFILYFFLNGFITFLKMAWIKGATLSEALKMYAKKGYKIIKSTTFAWLGLAVLGLLSFVLSQTLPVTTIFMIGLLYLLQMALQWLKLSISVSFYDQITDLIENPSV